MTVLFFTECGDPSIYFLWGVVCEALAQVLCLILQKSFQPHNRIDEHGLQLQGNWNRKYKLYATSGVFGGEGVIGG